MIFSQLIMINSSRLEKEKKKEDSIIKDVRNIFRLKNEINGNTTKEIRYIFRLNKK